MKTVEMHLSNAYLKLDIGSRGELEAALRADGPSATAPGGRRAGAAAALIGSSAATAMSRLTASISSGSAARLTFVEKPIGASSGRKKSSKWLATTTRGLQAPQDPRASSPR